MHLGVICVFTKFTQHWKYQSDAYDTVLFAENKGSLREMLQDEEHGGSKL